MSTPACSRAAAAVLATAILAGASGCSDDPPARVSVAPAGAPAPPAYDASLAPSAAVLALVPDAATMVALTDFSQIRDDLGVGELGTASPVTEQDAFWARAQAEAPLLTGGLLRAAEAQLRADYGISELDVAWEAQFFDADGARLGWALSMLPGTDLGAVDRAIADRAGPLARAVVRPDDLLVTSGVTDDGAQSWAADPALVDLVGLGGAAWLVSRACVSDPAVPSTLTELGSYSVQLESALVTARLGPDRLDLFDRMRLSTDSPAFAAALTGGVADPSTGRIGFEMTQPAAAADLVEDGSLPFAACAP